MTTINRKVDKSLNISGLIVNTNHPVEGLHVTLHLHDIWSRSVRALSPALGEALIWLCCRGRRGGSEWDFYWAFGLCGEPRSSWRQKSRDLCVDKSNHMFVGWQLQSVSGLLWLRFRFRLEGKLKIYIFWGRKTIVALWFSGEAFLDRGGGWNNLGEKSLENSRVKQKIQCLSVFAILIDLDCLINDQCNRSIGFTEWFPCDLASTYIFLK